MTRAQQQVRLRQARYLLIEVLENHQAQCTEQHCMESTALMAWLGHAVGFRAEGTPLAIFLEQLDRYRRDCPGCGAAGETER